MPKIILFTVEGIKRDGKAVSFSSKEKAPTSLYDTEWYHHSDKGKFDLIWVLRNRGTHIRNNNVIQEFA